MSEVKKLVDAFIVTHRGDGRHASIVYTFEDAAREAIAGMWAGSLEEALEQEDLLAIYEAIRNPESDEWADYDGEEITFSFEDGSLSVLAIPVKVAALSHPAPDVPFDMQAHLKRQRDFSLKTFGPGARTKGVLDHIRKELAEIEADPADLKEWVDVIILAFDGAWRAGWEPVDILKAIEAKQTKNEGRVWPDWRTADPDKAIEHDRSHDDPAPDVPEPTFRNIEPEEVTFGPGRKAPGAEEVEAIRARHEADEQASEEGNGVPPLRLIAAHIDRGDLLRLLDAAQEELAKMQTPTIQWDPDDPEMPIDSVEELAERFVDYGNLHGVFAVDNAHVLPSTYHYFEAGIDDDTGNVGETYCVEITKDEYNGARAANAVGWFAKKAKWHTERLAAALKEKP